jgi:hypothetical protein
MALFSKTEYAEACGMVSNALAVYIKRGKVVVGEDGMIDTNEDKNIAFLEKMRSKKQGIVIPKEPKKKAPPVPTPVFAEESENNSENEGEIPSLAASERLLKHLDTQKREREVEKLDLEIEKKRGEVIPSELIKPVFLQHNQHLLMSMKNADDEMLSIFGHKYSLALEDIAWIRGEWTKKRNTAITEATSASVKAVDSIVADFSVKRGVGQK